MLFFTESENKINLILTGHDHISFSLQLEDTVICSCGTLSSREVLDLKGNTFSVINCYEDGFIEVERVFIENNQSELIGQYWINL